MLGKKATTVATYNNNNNYYYYYCYDYSYNVDVSVTITRNIKVYFSFVRTERNILQKLDKQ